MTDPFVANIERRREALKKGEMQLRAAYLTSVREAYEAHGATKLSELWGRSRARIYQLLDQEKELVG